MKTKEDKFLKELEVYRTEVESAIQFLYVDLAINSCLADNKRALDLINRTPLFWVTNGGALQTSFFITLGRIFDQDSKHNVDRLLKAAQENAEIFSADSLKARKIGSSANATEWITEYMKDVYVPTADDFRRLRGYVKKYRKIYVSGYRDIRRKVYAHKELTKAEDVQALFANTNIKEMQKLLIFLNRLYHALWQLFYNGRKPVLRPLKYSVESMKKSETPKWQSQYVQERVVNETVKFFKLLLTVPNEGLHRVPRKARLR